MKILTLNTHSLIEENYSHKLLEFVKGVAYEKPEIIALQEVNQTLGEEEVKGEIMGYTPCVDNVVIRRDNHVLRVSEMLNELGERYYWTWLPLKKGYEKYEEGISILSRSPIIETSVVPVSEIDDYENWKTRKLVGVRTENLPDEWFFSVHFGWWNDSEEPFKKQWIKTAVRMTEYDAVWLMGDFNSPAEIRNEGYDLIKRSYWFDSFELAEKKDSGITVKSAIDGWRGDNTESLRIDQIWCNKRIVVTDSRVIFNGENYPVVSDHYGVIINYERSIV